MATPSQAVTRNAALRTALTAAFPGVRFTVRNGPNALAAVRWTDGPTSSQVERVLRAVQTPAGPRSHWGYAIDRTETHELAAVGYLRAFAAKKNFYREQDPTTVRPGSEIASWDLCGGRVDAASITAAERAQAALVVALAVNDQHWRATGPTRAIARTVHLHGDVIAATTTD